MNKIKIAISLMIISIIMLPCIVFGQGSISVSKTNVSIIKGGSASISINANNAAGRIDIVSSDNNVATVSNSSVFLDMQSSTLIIKGVSVGSTTIKVVSTDVTTYDDENISGVTQIINVNVIEAPVDPNANLSKNNKIKELKIDGYELNKIDNNNYELVVSNNVSSVDLKVTLEDEKATVIGNGLQELVVGDNNIDVVVTSESGLKNVIHVKIKRKDGFYLEDLKEVIASNIDDANIIIDLDTKISKDDVVLIKSSKKLISFNCFDENSKLLYTWVLDGNKITEEKDMLTTVSFSTTDYKEISKLSNYADGLYVRLENEHLNGSTLRLYVKDKYDNNDLLNLYYYDNNSNKITLLKSNLEVKNDVVDLEISDNKQYFLSMTKIDGNIEEKESWQNNSYFLTSLVELGVIVFGVVALVVSKKRYNI